MIMDIHLYSFVFISIPYHSTICNANYIGGKKSRKWKKKLRPNCANASTAGVQFVSIRWEEQKSMCDFEPRDASICFPLLIPFCIAIVFHPCRIRKLKFKCARIKFNGVEFIVFTPTPLTHTLTHTHLAILNGIIFIAVIKINLIVNVFHAEFL